MVNMKCLCVDFRTVFSRTLGLSGVICGGLVGLVISRTECSCVVYVERKLGPDVYNIHEQVLSHKSLRQNCTEAALPAIITTLHRQHNEGRSEYNTTKSRMVSALFVPLSVVIIAPARAGGTIGCFDPRSDLRQWRSLPLLTDA